MFTSTGLHSLPLFCHSACLLCIQHGRLHRSRPVALHEDLSTLQYASIPLLCCAQRALAVSEIHNADILFRENCSADDLIDVIEVRAALSANQSAQKRWTV